LTFDETELNIHENHIRQESHSCIAISISEWIEMPYGIKRDVFMKIPQFISDEILSQSTVAGAPQSTAARVSTNTDSCKDKYLIACMQISDETVQKFRRLNEHLKALSDQDIPWTDLIRDDGKLRARIYLCPTMAPADQTQLKLVECDDEDVRHLTRIPKGWTAARESFDFYRNFTGCPAKVVVQPVFWKHLGKQGVFIKAVELAIDCDPRSRLDSVRDAVAEEMADEDLL
jgi:hypothetical protein